MKTVIIALSVLLLANVSQGVDVITGSHPMPDMAAFILTYGSYSNLQTGTEMPLESGLINIGIKSQRIVHQGEAIKAKPGTAIGVEFGLIVNTSNLSQILTFIISPPKDIQNPETGIILNQITFTRTIEQTKRNPFIGYLFDEEWECIPGIWGFQVKYRNLVIVEKQLSVNYDK